MTPAKPTTCPQGHDLTWIGDDYAYCIDAFWYNSRLAAYDIGLTCLVGGADQIVAHIAELRRERDEARVELRVLIDATHTPICWDAANRAEAKLAEWERAG